MPIKFSCPSCKKPLSVKDHLAGKKANCPACKKPLTIPAAAKQGVPQPEAHVEELAAAALIEPSAAPVPKVEDTRTVDFNCPQCDEPLKIPAELQGKQAPCPKCKRIIKVPLLVKRDPTDWRKGDTRVPSGARRDTEPAPEGAWGSTAMSAVSRQALLEAAPPPREPWTLRQKLTRGGALVGVLLAAGLGTWLGIGWWHQRQEKQSFDKALELLKAEDSKLSREERAILFIAAGEYRLRFNTVDGTKDAQDYFQQARKLIDGAPEGVEREMLLTELAVAQIELGGDSQQAARGERLDWDKAVAEVRQTLQLLHEPETRAEALARVSRKLIDKKQSDKLVPLANQLGSPRNVLNANGKQITFTPSDAPALLAVAALELLRAGEKQPALEQANRAASFYKAGEKAERPPLSAAVVALCRALDTEPPKPGGALDDNLNGIIGEAQGEVLRGNNDLARAVVGRIQEHEPRWRVLVAIASADKDKPDAGALDEAIGLVEGHLAGHAVSPWVMLRMFEVAAVSGIAEDSLQKIADSVGDANLAGRAMLAVLRAKLARTNDKVELSRADAINKNSPAHGEAVLEIARHNAKRKALSAKDVSEWDDDLKVFGYMGLALGRKDAE
jgi:hypothetical protein